ncbi:THAP domain-containing protein 5 [Nannospalax galili]|uniref:THAP domain-containing protein 5 n=1 Tax=Nannospalax galili TaxID=1026970 RepID=UPI00111C56B2|nr:THAP domain-containing protein 5 [Nannospalax galili]
MQSPFLISPASIKHVLRFPLHDKERLEKWLKNMKRDSWVPSKYQFLCSDHFTPDSLDIRWGIRYLKQTAIPTIFSEPEDSQGKDTSKKKSQKKKLAVDKEVCLKTNSEESFASNETKKNTGSLDVLQEHGELLDSSALEKPSAPKAESIQNNILTLKQDTLETSINQDLSVIGFCTSSENLNSTAITLTTSNSEDIITNHLPNPNFINKSMETRSRQGNQFFFSTVEEVNTNIESVIAIFIPTEISKPAVNSFISTSRETREMEFTDIIEDSLYKEVDHSAEVLQIEHSYCRQDVNKEHLW